MLWSDESQRRLSLVQKCDKLGALARVRFFWGLRACFLAKFKYSCALPCGLTQLTSKKALSYHHASLTSTYLGYNSLQKATSTTK
jgi:hypothetical protein